MGLVGYAERMGGEERCIQGLGGASRGKGVTWKTKAQIGG